MAQTFEIAFEIAFAGVAIPAGTLYFQVDHRRKDGAVVLGEGTMCYKVASQQGADLLGLSDFTYNEPVPCGTCRFTMD